MQRNPTSALHLLSTYYVPDSTYLLLRLYNGTLKTVLLFSPFRKWYEMEACQMQAKLSERERRDVCLLSALLQSQALPTARDATGALAMHVAWVSPGPAASVVSGGLTLAVNPLTGLFRECFLLCFTTFITLLFHISYPWRERSVHGLASSISTRQSEWVSQRTSSWGTPLPKIITSLRIKWATHCLPHPRWPQPSFAPSPFPSFISCIPLSMLLISIQPRGSLCVPQSHGSHPISSPSTWLRCLCQVSASPTLLPSISYFS